MRWTVVWDEVAQDELTDIWLNAPDPQAVSNASNAIDRKLRLNPLQLGEVENGHFRYTEPPLEVHYIVSPDDCLVRVLHVALAL